MKHLTRRDRCYLVGKRARLLNPSECYEAWMELTEALITNLGERDVPKFSDLISAIRFATINSKKIHRKFVIAKFHDSLLQ